ncbi:hypothetical protein DXG03_008674 [Asterophora parasitica]|uniref:F-box domain-containing protein n=1 Tax=Asterophora parasitica TaxID=117018 RepID=A0A9P7G457_9AGAR|nr:hypothetical protein DXG03_008674 [Asterophora parasitica]
MLCYSCQLQAFKPLSEGAVLALEASVSCYQSKTSDFKNNTPSPASEGSDPVDALLRTNYRPDNHQTRVLDAILDQQLAEIADLDHSISSLQVKMDKLLKEMKAVSATRLNRITMANFYKSLLSPIRLLPPEILGQIFLYAVESHAPVRRGSPLSFTLVCSAWRQAALGCSNLWNDLELSPGYPAHPGNPLCPQKFSALFSLWFRRAHPVQPLRLSLHFDAPAVRLEEDYINQLCRSVASVSPRLSELSVVFFGGCYNVFEPFLSNASEDLAVLEALTLLNYSRSEEVFPAVKVFHDAPRLRKVYLRVRENILIDSSRFSLPWSQLNVVDIRGLSLGDFVEVIFQCPQLRVGHFTHVKVGNRINQANGQLLLPDIPMIFPFLVDFKLQLCGLELQFDPVDLTFLDVTEALQFPVIERLAMASDHPYSQIPFVSVLRILTDLAMRQSLRSISLFNVDTTELAQLSDCIAGCHLLEDFSLCMAGATPEMAVQTLQRLWLLAVGKSTSSSLQSKPLSHLRAFKFAFVYPDNPEYRTIGMFFGRLVADLIEDSTRHRPLESACLYICDYHRDNFGREKIEALTADVKAPIRDAESRIGTAGSKTIDLDIKVFTSHYALSPAFDLLEPNENLRRWSRFRS